MAHFMDQKNASISIGTVASADATVPIFRLDKEYGAITIENAYVTSIGANGTLASAYICTLTDAVVPITAVVYGTLPTASGTLAACGARAFTMGTSIVTPGTSDEWVGLKLTGTIIAPVHFVISYYQGRNY